ncbi:MAG: DUF2254 domain-containing protein [Chloroflexota bacterium]|nr:DUF2254 domain-containing protein [Chloroflexota bacterium]
MRESLRRALSSFLAVPTGVIIIFVLLALGTYTLEQADLGWLRPLRNFMEAHVFGDPEATSALLGTIAGGVITITSITFSLLLLALQQSAGSMTHQVLDQFLRRRLNQLYFGFFVGMALYALITLATVDPPFNPVLGATLALILALVALYVLLLLIYSTISQMRPTDIVRTIHDHTLRARQRQLALIRRTRRSSRLPSRGAIALRAPRDGFIVEIDLEAIEAALKRASTPVEIVFHLSIGSYVAFQDQIAEVRAERDDDATRIAFRVERAIHLGRERNLDNDPAYGIEQLATIAWRSISTSQQNPSPGIATIHNLRDLLARWAMAEEDEPEAIRLPVIYPDNVMACLLGAFESLAVVASEAMQHQTYAAILRTFALNFDRLPLPEQQRAEQLLLRTIPGLGDHLLTTELDDALTALVQTLEQAERLDAAEAFRTARTDLVGYYGHASRRRVRPPGAAGCLKRLAPKKSAALPSASFSAVHRHRVTHIC